MNNLSILFAEDEPEARKNIAEIISRRVKVLYEAENGKEALELYKKHSPDVVITDIQMPKMDGLQLTEEIKKINPNVIVIIATAFTDTDYMLKSIELQVDGYLIKPVRKDELIKILIKFARIIDLKVDNKKKELDLILSEKKYKLLTESLHDVVISLSPTGERLYVSPSIKNFLGYDAGLYEGDSIFNMFLHQNEKEQAIQLLHGIAKNHQSGVFEFTYKPYKNKRKPFPVEVSYNPLIKDGNIESIQLVMRDVTQRKKNEEIIIQSKNRYKLLFNQISDPIVIFDQRTKLILDSNKAMISKYGYSLEELRQMTVYELHTSGEDFDKLRKSINSKNKSSINTYKHINKTGEVFSVEINTEAISYKNTDAWISIIRDITDRKKTEEIIIKHNVELKERNEELGAFSHTVAHDLKNPLGTILGFAGLLYDDFDKLTRAEIDEYISTIIRSGNKTQQIINSLLMFASARKEEIVTSEIKICNTVKEALNRFATKDKYKRIKFILPNKFPVVMGNSAWVEEVWANYISNAIKYGGENPTIELGYDGDYSNIKDAMVRFWVRDNGEGITDEDQELLFNKYQRLDQSEINGHGLGLSIVKRIINKLGGEVGVESKVGEGSLFYFTLPLATNTDKEMCSCDTSIEKPKQKPKSLKILIAEDEPTSSNLLRLFVKNISNQTFLANNGAEAVEIFKQNPDIDLILMDLKMPILNGLEATKQIRKISNDVAIIAQTAFTHSNDRKKTEQAGCNDYLTKPISKTKLMELIKKWTNIDI